MSGHHGLLSKLKLVGLDGQIFNFIYNFLKGRSIRVEVDGISSGPAALSIGVPQGSVLGPSLFSVLINDIFDTVPPAVKKSLYADDGALWVCSPSISDASNTLQISLDGVAKWSDRWGLNISHSKTHIITFSLKKTPLTSPLLLKGNPLPVVNTVKFLGLTFDSRLTWGPHTLLLKSKCQADLRLLSMVSRNNWGSDANILRTLYISLIRSKLDYGSFLYSGASKSNLLLLERIQYAACRAILGALKPTPTFKLEVEANLMPLNLRRNSLMSQYSCRVLSIPSHPYASLLKTYSSFSNLLSNTYILPTCERNLSELSDMGISVQGFPSLSMKTDTHVFRSLLMNLSVSTKRETYPLLNGALNTLNFPHHILNTHTYTLTALSRLNCLGLQCGHPLFLFWPVSLTTQTSSPVNYMQSSLLSPF